MSTVDPSPDCPPCPPVPAPNMGVGALLSPALVRAAQAGVRAEYSISSNARQQQWRISRITEAPAKLGRSTQPDETCHGGQDRTCRIRRTASAVLAPLRRSGAASMHISLPANTGRTSVVMQMRTDPR